MDLQAKRTTYQADLDTLVRERNDQIERLQTAITQGRDQLVQLVNQTRSDVASLSGRIALLDELLEHGGGAMFPLLEVRQSMTLRQRVRWVVFKTDTERDELLSGVLLAVLGTIFLLRPQTIQTLPGYAAIRSLPVPSLVWGWLFLVLGVAQVVALFRNHCPTRRALCMASVSCWLFVHVMYLLATPGAFAPWPCLGMAILSAVAWLRLYRNETL